MKVGAVITVTDGVPNCHTVGDVGLCKDAFRSIKKGGWQGFEEANFISARGLEGRAKFRKPEEPPKSKARKKTTAKAEV